MVLLFSDITPSSTCFGIPKLNFLKKVRDYSTLTMKSTRKSERIRIPRKSYEAEFWVRKGYKRSRGTFPEWLKIKIIDSQTVNGQVYCCHCCKPIPRLKGNIHIDHLYAWVYTGKIGLHYYKDQYLMASCARCNTSRGSGGRNLSRPSSMNHLPPCTPPKKTLGNFMKRVFGYRSNLLKENGVDETEVSTRVPVFKMIDDTRKRLSF